MNRTLTRRITFIEQFDLFVGIDLGKRKNVAVIIDQQLRQHGRTEFGHSREAYNDLADWLGRKRAGRAQPTIVIGMEPTNDYWQWLAKYLTEAGIVYRLVNSYTVKKSREGSQLSQAKDDRRDALTIARLLRQGQYTETQLLPDTYAQMRQYEQARWQLKQALRRQKTLLRQQVERLFPELSQVFKGLTGQTALAVLQNHADPQVIAGLSWAAFRSRVQQDFNGQRLVTKKLHQVYELAPTSIGLQPGPALQHLIQQQIAMLTLQQQQLAALEAELVACLHTLPAAPYFLSLGLGEVTTALVVAELGDLSRFSSPKQLVKLAGIQPTPNQSGQYQRSKTPMSHKGRVRLRTYLFFATMRLIQWDTAFRQRQQALVNRSRKPLRPKEAIGVLMNKLLHLIWVVQKQQTSYVSARFAAT